MPDQLSLPRCVLPGCKQSVGRWGDVCDGCRDAFGERLRATDGPGMTAEEITRRDAEVREVYARRLIR
jgi:hypothetical protein